LRGSIQAFLTSSPLPRCIYFNENEGAVREPPYGFGLEYGHTALRLLLIAINANNVLTLYLRFKRSHCEEQSDAAIHLDQMDCFILFAMTNIGLVFRV